MKRELIKKRTLLLLTMGLSISLMTATARAATNGTLLLSGSVNAILSLSVTPNGTNNSTLDIVAGESAKNVATVTETSNNLTGYHIDVSSANNGELRRNGTSSLYKTAYQISYDGGAYFTPTTSDTEVKNVASLAGLTSDTSDVLINVTAYPTAPEGNYSDTLSFTITANP